MPDSTVVSSLFLCALLLVGCGSRTSLDFVAVGSPREDARVSVDAGLLDASESFDSGTSSAKPDAGLDFPVGTFNSCAEGLFGPDGNTFLNTSGIEQGAVLTVTREGSHVTATFTDENNVTSSFTFTPTTNSSAVLSGSAVVDGFSGLCVQGPGDEGAFSATVNVGSGSLTYDASTMFIAVEGAITGGEGSPCGSSTAPGRVSIVCSDSSPPSGGDTLAVAASFPTGSFACSSQLGTYIESNGVQDYSASGDTGTLVVTQSGATVTASYTGDSSVSGTLDFTITSPSTANIMAGESLTAPCTVPISITGPPPSETPEPMSVAAASLTVSGPALSLSFRGTMVSSCTGALAMGSLLCAMQ